MSKLAVALALGVGQGFWLSAWAAGNVDQVRGEAAAINRDGQPRGLAKGDRVIEGETVVTGSDGEVLLTTDDSGVLAVRPRSRVLIDNYRVNGGENDSVVLRLLRGGLRSITGWIGKTAPRNYRVITPTATVGIRGTDHELAVIEGGQDEGSTVNQVTTGETTLSTPAGTINIGAGQVGAATSLNAVPQSLPAPPPGLFVPRPTDARVGELKQDAEGQQEQRLRARQQQNQRSGGTTEQGNPRVSAQCAPGSPANEVLNSLLRAYERGDAAFLQRRLDPAMVGYGTLLNEVLSDNAAQRQTRVQVLDTQMQCGPDVAVIDFAWEKRYLRAGDFAPQLERGRSSVLLTQLGAGLSGQWFVGGLVGDNPFKGPTAAASVAAQPNLGRAASLQATAAYNYGSLAQVTFPLTVSPNAPSGPSTYTINFNQAQQLQCSVTAFTHTCNASSPGFVVQTTAATSPVGACAVSQTPFTGATGQFQFQPDPQSVSISDTLTANAGDTLALVYPVNFAAQATVLNASQSFTVSSNVASFCNVTAVVPSKLENLPVQIEVSDADVTSPSVQVQARASNGDAQILTLPQVAPGLFRLNSLPVTFGAAVQPNNGRIELPGSNQGNITLSLTYTDQAPGTAGGPVQRTATMVLQPGVQIQEGVRRRR